MSSAEEAKKLFIEGLKSRIEAVGTKEFFANFTEVVHNWTDPEYFYEPSDALRKRLDEYRTWCATKTGENPGKLMEEIALLAIKSLKGYGDIRSYQSYAAQIDLLVSGSDPDWCLLHSYLHLDERFRSIVVEAKNLNKKVDDKQFSRFCYHIQNTFVSTAQLGIFFTRFGATGFPEVSKKVGKRTRQRALRDAQATQVLFHAKNNKFIVVLEHEELLQLDQSGALPRLIEAKIREVEQWSGLQTYLDESLTQVDLPEHLSRHM